MNLDHSIFELSHAFPICTTDRSAQTFEEWHRDGFTWLKPTHIRHVSLRVETCPVLARTMRYHELMSSAEVLEYMLHASLRPGTENHLAATKAEGHTSGNLPLVALGTVITGVPGAEETEFCPVLHSADALHPAPGGISWSMGLRQGYWNPTCRFLVIEQ